MRKLTVLLGLSLIATGLAVAQVEAAAPKAGTACTKLNQAQVSGGYTYTCIKSGKKLVWSKGVKVAAPAPVASPIPVPSPTPTSVDSPVPTPSPSASPTASDDFLSFKSDMLYGISGSSLTRKAANGVYFVGDSRSESNFDPVRARAFEELNTNTGNTSHQNVEIIYDISPSYPKVLVDYSKRQIEEAARFWNSLFTSPIKVYVHLVTEQDREAIKADNFMAQNLPADFDRFDAKVDRPYISGGGGYWPHSNGTYAELFLATASYLDLSYVNSEWPQVAKHEFVHIAQDYVFYKNGRVRPSTQDSFDLLQPLNFREGSANTIGYLTGFNNLGWASDALDWRLWETLKNSSGWNSLATLADVRTAVELTANHSSQAAFDAAYPIGALMYEWLIGTYGLSAYFKLLNSLSTQSSFEDDLKSAIGLTKDEFYDQTSAYIFKNIQRIRS